MSNKLLILGIRGIPAGHGGFETFAERLSLYMQSRGWEVSVYCQENEGKEIWYSSWNNIRRIHVPVGLVGSLGSVIFDLKSVIHSLSVDGVVLTLGYNTAVFNLLYRLFGRVNIINMDGIEWRRDKWGFFAKNWFWINERIGCWVGNHLVADNPFIKSHLETRVRGDKISMIPYGGFEVESASPIVLSRFGIEPGRFSVLIARPEPENSVLEIVRAFSRVRRNHRLVVLGQFDPSNNPYHRMVIESASDEVIFPGPIYDASIVGAIRFHCRCYLHGHRVGGTNPSLVEALGAGCAVIAHDNRFNRWVAGEGAVYFSDEGACAALVDKLLGDDNMVARMKASSRIRFRERFRWEQILSEYETLLSNWHPSC